MLDAIDGETPHRYRLTLGDAADVDRALADLLRPGSRVVAATTDIATDGTATIDVDARFMPRSGAVIGPMSSLRGAGIPLRGLDYLDLVDDVSDSQLERAVTGWEQFANRGPHRARLERLAGQPLLERCVGGYSQSRRPAYRFAASCVAANTPGSHARLVGLAAEAWQARDGRATHAWLQDAWMGAWAADLAGIPTSVDAGALVPLLDAGALAGGSAIRLLQFADAPLDDSVAAALVRLTRSSDGEIASAAMGALERAVPTEEVRAATDAGLDVASGDVRAAALGVLARHWSDEARPVWRAWLRSSSLACRFAAEEALGEHGTIEDLPDAAATLARLIRSKGMTHEPPRGAEIITLLARHPDEPVARTALADLRARWDRLPEGYERWIERHHPELAPAAGPRSQAGPLDEESIDEEAELEWPFPAVDRQGDTFHVAFDDLGARSAVRDRFEAALEAADGVTILDADREFLDLRVAGPDPVDRLAALWRDAQEPRAR